MDKKGHSTKWRCPGWPQTEGKRSKQRQIKCKGTGGTKEGNERKEEESRVPGGQGVKERGKRDELDSGRERAYRHEKKSKSTGEAKEEPCYEPDSMPRLAAGQVVESE